MCPERQLDDAGIPEILWIPDIADIQGISGSRREAFPSYARAIPTVLQVHSQPSRVLDWIGFDITMLKLDVRHQTIKGDQINRLVRFSLLALHILDLELFNVLRLKHFFLSHSLISYVNKYKWVQFFKWWMLLMMSIQPRIRLTITYGVHNRRICNYG